MQLSAGNLDEALESYRGLVAATGQSDTQDLYLGVPRSQPVPIPVHPAAPRPVKKEEPWSVTLAEQGKAAARMIEEGERSRARRYGKKKQGQSPRAVKVESIVAAEPFQFLEVSPPPSSTFATPPTEPMRACGTGGQPHREEDSAEDSPVAAGARRDPGGARAALAAPARARGVV